MTFCQFSIRLAISFLRTTIWCACHMCILLHAHRPTSHYNKLVLPKSEDAHRRFITTGALPHRLFVPPRPPKAPQLNIRIRNGVQKPTITPTTLAEPLARIPTIIDTSVSYSYRHLFLVLHRCIYWHFHHPSHLRAKRLLPSAPCPIHRCFLRTFKHPFVLPPRLSSPLPQPVHHSFCD